MKKEFSRKDLKISPVSFPISNNSVGHTKFFKYADEIATQMGTPLTKVTFEEFQQIGDINTFILKLVTDDQLVNVLIYQSELDNLINDQHCNGLDNKISMALLRLKYMPGD